MLTFFFQPRLQSSAIKLPKRDALGPLEGPVEEHIRQLETSLINALSDNSEFKAEYERIAEEGRLLYTTYASKSSQLKHLAVENVRLQSETQAAK